MGSFNKWELEYLGVGWGSCTSLIRSIGQQLWVRIWAIRFGSGHPAILIKGKNKIAEGAHRASGRRSDECWKVRSVIIFLAFLVLFIFLFHLLLVSIWSGQKPMIPITLEMKKKQRKEVKKWKIDGPCVFCLCRDCERGRIRVIEIEIECEDVDRGKKLFLFFVHSESGRARVGERREPLWLVRGEFLMDSCIFCSVLDWQWQGWRRIRPCVWAWDGCFFHWIQIFCSGFSFHGKQARGLCLCLCFLFLFSFWFSLLQPAIRIFLIFMYLGNFSGPWNSLGCWYGRTEAVHEQVWNFGWCCCHEGMIFLSNIFWVRVEFVVSSSYKDIFYKISNAKTKKYSKALSIDVKALNQF